MYNSYVCVNALLSQGMNEELPATEKLNRYDLSKKINDAKNEIELTTAEIIQIQEAVAKTYTAFVYGQIYYLLEGK